MSAVKDFEKLLESAEHGVRAEFMGGGNWATVTCIDGADGDVLVVVPSECGGDLLDVTRMPEDVFEYGDMSPYGKHTMTLSPIEAARCAVGADYMVWEQ